MSAKEAELRVRSFIKSLWVGNTDPILFKVFNAHQVVASEETERPITVFEGTNKVIGINTEVIINEINSSLGSKLPNEINIKNWDGLTSSRIYDVLY
jgi:UDP-N-acetylglucosamine 2-epimerase